MSNSNGEILHLNRFKQVLSFIGIQYGTITLTDVDAIMEYHDVAWFYFEVKKKGKTVDTGQRLTMDRFTKDMFSIGKFAIAIVAEHDVDNPNEIVYLKDCVVRELKIDNNSWRKPDRPITVKEMTDICINHINNGTTSMLRK